MKPFLDMPDLSQVEQIKRCGKLDGEGKLSAAEKSAVAKEVL